MKKLFILALIGLIHTTGFSVLVNRPGVKYESEQNLSIEINYYNIVSRNLRLTDGTIWDLNYTFDSFGNWLQGKDVEALWLNGDAIEIYRNEDNHFYPYYIHNLTLDQWTEARQIDPSLYPY